MFCKIKCIIFRVKVQIQLCFLLTQASFLDKTIIIVPLQALCQVTAIYLLLYLTPSAEHRTYLPRLYFQEDGKQVSCFTYKLFMVMLKDFSNHWGCLLTIMTHLFWCNLVQFTHALVSVCLSSAEVSSIPSFLGNCTCSKSVFFTDTQNIQTSFTLFYVLDTQLTTSQFY